MMNQHATVIDLGEGLGGGPVQVGRPRQRPNRRCCCNFCCLCSSFILGFILGALVFGVSVSRSPIPRLAISDLPIIIHRNTTLDSSFNMSISVFTPEMYLSFDGGNYTVLYAGLPIAQGGIIASPIEQRRSEVTAPGTIVASPEVRDAMMWETRLEGEAEVAVDVRAHDKIYLELADRRWVVRNHNKLRFRYRCGLRMRDGDGVVGVGDDGVSLDSVVVDATGTCVSY